MACAGTDLVQENVERTNSSYASVDGHGDAESKGVAREESEGDFEEFDLGRQF